MIAGLLCATASCAHKEPYRLQGEAQGTYYSILYYDRQGRDLRQAVDSLLTAFDQVASLWVEGSEIRRANANQTDSVSPLFEQLLNHSAEMNRYTDGAFDCRIGRIVQAWGFSFRQREAVDSATLAAMLAAARGTVSATNGHISKDNAATELDFNAIAQGYSVDLLARMFDSLGVTSYLIDVGGEVTARGSKADGQPWKVGIERPAPDRYAAPEVETAIALRNTSVVTSGSYRKYYERDGLKYSHTIDPATGRPVGHTLLSVSVVDDECWLADAMATAYMVMGLDSALAFIARHPDGPGTQAVFFIYDDGTGMQTYATPQFNNLEQ